MKKLANRYSSNSCQSRIDRSVVLKKSTIISRLIPWGETKRAAILPTINRTARPISGEKITGSRIGRRATPLVDLNGWKVSPSSVLVQIYAAKIRNVLFFMWVLQRFVRLNYRMVFR